MFDIIGTSNATTVSFTLPYSLNVFRNSSVACLAGDNGSLLTTPGRIDINTSYPTLVNIYSNFAGAGWTNSGTKEVGGEFWYQSA